MPGTVSGGRKAVATQISKIGYDAYKQRVQAMGRKGGYTSRGGGFAKDHDKAVEAGRKGGLASRRRGNKTIPCPHCDGMYSTAGSRNSHVTRYHASAMLKP